ncbi:procollagen C-endopeptidase enhancer 2, partial [Clonorchis sinensis]
MLFLPLVCCVFGLYVACGLECGEVLKGESGEFRSPGYPVVYPDNLNCTWNIYKPRGLSVLVFPTFEVEESYTGERCEYDFVHITVGTGDDQVIHGPFCGFKPPAPIVFQKHVTVQFISDGSRAFQGFEAVFLLVKTYIPTPPRIEHTTEAQQEVSTQNADVPVDLKCGEVLDGDSGHFHSPGYPKSYPDNLKCTWKIQKPRGLSELKFLSFDIEESYTGERCEYDFVHITVGTGDDQLKNPADLRHHELV